MKSILCVKEEDRDELKEYVVRIQKHAQKQQEQVERFSSAKKSVELLSTAWKQLSAMNLDNMDPAIIRNAEMMTHFMEECRAADREAALNANIAQALNEALTLKLAEKYQINIQQEWHLDLEKGILTHENSVQPPQD